MEPSKDFDSERARRRQILRRAALYSYGFLLAAVVLAVAGSALIAWLLSRTGLPFLATWLVVLAIVLGIPLIGVAVSSLRGNGHKSSE